MVAMVTVLVWYAAPEIARPGADGADVSPHFRKLDANSDGRIDPDEFAASRKNPAARKRATAAFKRLDRDGSGGLSPEEFPARRKAGRPAHPQG